MNAHAAASPYGALIEPATLKIERLLPGRVERVWAYLADSELRRQWLADGEIEMLPGAQFAFVWRNDELSDPPGARPEGFPEEHRMESRVVAADLPHRLVITWGANEAGEVAFELAPAGDGVLLTIVHRRLPDRASMLNVSAGWHMHLDILAARMSGATVPAFWAGWQRLKAEYDRRLPA